MERIETDILIAGGGVAGLPLRPRLLLRVSTPFALILCHLSQT